MSDHDPTHHEDSSGYPAGPGFRRVTHTGTIDFRIAAVTAHVLDDGSRVIPLASAARLLTDDASATEILLTPPNGSPAAADAAGRITTYLNLHGGREAGLSVEVLVELLVAHAEGRAVDEGPGGTIPHPLEAKARGRALRVVRLVLHVGIEVESGGW